MPEITEEILIPKELWEKVISAVYRLCEWGIPESGAIEIARIIIDNYWREKNVDKSWG